MKTISKITLALLPLAFFASSMAQAADTKFYGGIKLGDSYTMTKYDYKLEWMGEKAHADETFKKSVFSANPFVGVDFKYNSLLGQRVELEGFFHGKAKSKVKGDRVEVQSNGFFVNTYLDFHVNKVVAPYVGLGIGYAHNKIDQSFDELDNSKDSVAAQIGGGVLFNVTDNLGIDLNVRYACYGDYETKTSGYDFKAERDVTLGAVEFLAGVKYTF